MDYLCLASPMVLFPLVAINATDSIQSLLVALMSPIAEASARPVQSPALASVPDIQGTPNHDKTNWLSNR